MEQESVKVEVTARDRVGGEELAMLRDFFKRGYGGRWIGDENFWTVMAHNFTQLLRLYSRNQLAAALLIDTKRISDIAVDPGCRGRGLGVKLLEEAAKVYSNVWISVGIDAEGMMATITDQGLNYLPVEDKQEIETLFKDTNRARGDYQVEISEVVVPLLSDRLAAKGIVRDKFMAFSRINATHGSVYKQILFQNQG